MDARGKLTVALLGLSALAGTALGLGVGRPPRPENPGVAAVREASRFPGKNLFTERKCVVCHGPDGGGTDMGPGLGALMPEYLAAANGDEAAAREMIVRYLKNPKGVRVLRRDSKKYENPMPGAGPLGLTDEDCGLVADFLLTMKPASMAVGGNATGR